MKYIGILILIIKQGKERKVNLYINKSCRTSGFFFFFRYCRVKTSVKSRIIFDPIKGSVKERVETKENTFIYVCLCRKNELIKLYWIKRGNKNGLSRYSRGLDGRKCHYCVSSLVVGTIYCTHRCRVERTRNTIITINSRMRYTCSNGVKRTGHSNTGRTGRYDLGSSEENEEV